jgi:hypothetical protein
MSYNLPIDVLLMILDHVDEADLVTVCRVNKVCCSCSQDILYRNICVQTAVCRTLALSTHLARVVRSFSVGATTAIYEYPETIVKALQNMLSLRSLTMCIQGKGQHPSNIFDECTFKLDSFTCNLFYTESLRNFLNNQPSLTHVALDVCNNCTPAFEAKCLPNLTRVSAWFYHIPYLIPGRPVKEVCVIGDPWGVNPFDLSHFSHSTVPIQKLASSYRFLFHQPVQLLASIFPSLAHLRIDLDFFLDRNDVRESLFHFSNHWIIEQ